MQKKERNILIIFTTSNIAKIIINKKIDKYSKTFRFDPGLIKGKSWIFQFFIDFIIFKSLISLKYLSGSSFAGGIHINPTTSKPRDLQYECKSDTDDLFTPNFWNFSYKSKFFKKSQYVFSPRFILGTVFAFVGVFGFATSGLIWEFKGIELGLTALITSFIALLFSIVFLFPFSKAKREQPLMQNNIVKVKISRQCSRFRNIIFNSFHNIKIVELLCHIFVTQLFWGVRWAPPLHLLYNN